MRAVPKAVDEAFYAGKRTNEFPFAINDAVDIVDGPYAGRVGSVISIGSIEPEVTFLVELNDGRDVFVPVSVMRRYEG